MIPGYEHVYSGKVRDLYRDSEGRLLFVASDRISAYDWILPTPIPDKGRILTQLSNWWFDRTTDIVPNHLISTEVPEQVAGRAVLCEPLRMLPVECVVRGHLSGSGWREYAQTQAVCGIALPPDLRESEQLPEPIFTPATKAAIGDHDENISFDQAAEIVGLDLAAQLRDISLEIYGRAVTVAAYRGLTLADTKFEFGQRADGTVVLADELLTPDSSRFWETTTVQLGESPPSYDKQFVRDWLASPESGWDVTADVPPPALPEPVVEQTRIKYVQAYERITGNLFDSGSAT